MVIAIEANYSKAVFLLPDILNARVRAALRRVGAGSLDPPLQYRRYHGLSACRMSDVGIWFHDVDLNVTK